MKTREDLIVSALNGRLHELRRKHILRLAADSFGEDAAFVLQMQKQLADASLECMGALPLLINAWMDCETDCLSSLRALSLGEPLRLREAMPPAAESLLRALDEHKRNPEQRFRLLTERYSCPLNVALASENEICEHILARLMVQDRATIERKSLSTVCADDLLLKLNLVAIAARIKSDLRFLDALNYYYELLPADWVPRANDAWLLASYLGLYARALAVRILRNQTIAHSDTREHSARRAADL